MQDNTSVREILEQTGKYTSFTAGRSMWPLIHHQKDNIIVVKPEGRLKKYDIALYEHNGKYIMHRVIEVHPDHYIIIGDNCITKEYVTDDMVCGELIGFYKNGKDVTGVTSFCILGYFVNNNLRYVSFSYIFSVFIIG